jgi:hypothetical protein
LAGDVQMEDGEERIALSDEHADPFELREEAQNGCAVGDEAMDET